MENVRREICFFGEQKQVYMVTKRGALYKGNKQKGKKIQFVGKKLSERNKMPNECHILGRYLLLAQ
jgi:hypothetical protein